MHRSYGVRAHVMHLVFLVKGDDSCALNVLFIVYKNEKKNNLKGLVIKAK